MGTRERRQREKEHRKTSIIDAAERVFFAKGMTAATMDEVAENAELSKGTLYLYFKSKEELYLAIILRASRLLHNMFLGAIQPGASGLEQIRSIGLAYYRFFKQHPDYFEALLYFEQNDVGLPADDDSFIALCCEQSEHLFTVVIGALQKGIEDKSIRSDLEPKQTAFVLWGQTTGMLQIASTRGEHLTAHHQIDPEALVLASFELILTGLASGSVPGRNGQKTGS